jgi:uncharacterized protein (DUF2164 family)
MSILESGEAMDLKLPKDLEQRLTGSTRRFLTENFGEDVGDLKASLFLKFCMVEIAPTVYNRAIADARSFMQEKVLDLENVCFAHEEGYWAKAAPGRAVARRPDSKR